VNMCPEAYIPPRWTAYLMPPGVSLTMIEGASERRSYRFHHRLSHSFTILYRPPKVKTLNASDPSTTTMKSPLSCTTSSRPPYRNVLTVASHTRSLTDSLSTHTYHLIRHTRSHCRSLSRRCRCRHQGHRLSSNRSAHIAESSPSLSTCPSQIKSRSKSNSKWHPRPPQTRTLPQPQPPPPPAVQR
jgi:hypothetical protein